MFDMEYKKKVINILVNSVWLFDNAVFVFYNIDSRRPLTFAEFKDVLKENNIDYNDIVLGSYLKCFGSPGRI